MSKNLTGGTEDLLGGINNLSKDVINKLQIKDIVEIDSDKEEADWWLPVMTKLKIKKSMSNRILDFHKLKTKQKKPCCKKIDKKYIIPYDSDKKQTWDIFILCLSIYSGFVVPLDFAFSPFFLQKISGKLLNYTIDILFVVDLILGFFTTFTNLKGI